MVPACRNHKVGQDLVNTVLSGGYPEPLYRPTWNRRRAWYTNYVTAIIQRDVRDIARIHRLSLMPKLLAILAEYSGQLINYSSVGAAAGLNNVSARTYIGILENLYLLKSLNSWYSNTLKRLVKAPKLQFLDSGLLAALKNIDPERIRRNRALLGPLLESFVYAELLKLASWTDDHFTFSHFRDKDGKEVDFVIEKPGGELVGIEVKAAATVHHRAFSGLRSLAAACGDRFKLGIILCDKDETIRFGNRPAAVPLSPHYGRDLGRILVFTPIMRLRPARSSHVQHGKILP